MTKSHSLWTHPDVAPRQVGTSPPDEQEAGPARPVRNGCPPHRANEPGVARPRASSPLSRSFRCRLVGRGRRRSVGITPLAFPSGSGPPEPARSSAGSVSLSVSRGKPRWFATLPSVAAKPWSFSVWRGVGGSGRGYEKPFLRGYVKGRRALSSSRHTRRPPVAEMPAGKGGPSLCPQAGLCWPQAKSGSTPLWLCPRRGDSSLLGMSFVSRYWKAMRSSGFRETSLNREKHPFPEIEMKRH